MLEEAAANILSGKAMIDGKRLNPQFMPTPPQLALICEAVRHVRYKRTGPRIAYTRPDPVVELTPEEKQRRALKVQAASRLIGNVTAAADPFPNETRERLAAIAAKARERQQGVSSKPADR